jgi:hypothetical protein
MFRTRSCLLPAAALAAAAIAYTRFVRPLVLNWGARSDEVERVLPGDDLLPEASLETTRAITIDVPASRVWPWIVQMGPRPRAGVYTYDWIERLLGLDIENSDRILPEFQHMDEGEFFPLGGRGKGLRIVRVDAGHSLVMQWEPAKSTWAFCLLEEDGHSTRLISRNRLPGSGPAFRLMAAVMEPASLVMERKMLQGIKQRAEQEEADAPAPAFA